jgi:GxxExxY protein
LTDSDLNKSPCWGKEILRKRRCGKRKWRGFAFHLLFPYILFLNPQSYFPGRKIMPIRVGAEIRRMEQEEFKARVYEVMRHVFDVQRELGRLFHEKIYHREIAYRIPDAQCEVALDVQFEDFCKTYYLDLLVGGGAIFELKAVELLAEPHRRQLMHYLFLADLPHGKLVNLRPERVDHEFVNNVMSRPVRTSVEVVDDGWEELETRRLKDGIIAVLRDWGIGLDMRLYEEVAAHLCGQAPDAETDVGIHLGNRLLGTQRMRLATPEVAIRISALPQRRYAAYRTDLHTLLDHADLRAIQWINITQPEVRFETI